MSNIIKRRNLKLSEPRVINIKTLCEMEKQINSRVGESSRNPVNQGQSQQLQDETDIIIAETEEMVKELLDKARDEARAIIFNAREEADIIKIQAQEEAEALRTQARKLGYSEGFTSAREEMAAGIAEAEKESIGIIEKAQQSRIKIINSCESEILKLVMAVSRRVVAGEVASNPEVVLNIVREAISFLENSDNVNVYVNTAELTKVREELEANSGGEPNLLICADQQISPGGCMVENGTASLDARIETRLTIVEELFEDGAYDER